MLYRYRLRAALVLSVAIFTSCTSNRIRTDFDPEVRFSDMATYSWIDRDDAQYGDDLTLLSPWLSRHLQSVADEALHGRGYQRTTARESDFRIVYRVAADAETRASPNYGYGFYVGRGYAYNSLGRRPLGFGHGRNGYGGFGYGGYYRPYHVRHDLRVTLVLEIFDARENQLVWHGLASGLLNVDPKPEEVREFLSEAVAGILEEFPPQREGEDAPRLVAP